MLEGFKAFVHDTVILRYFEKPVAFIFMETKKLAHKCTLPLQAKCLDGYAHEDELLEAFKRIERHLQNLKQLFPVCISLLRPGYSCGIDHNAV